MGGEFGCLMALDSLPAHTTLLPAHACFEGYGKGLEGTSSIHEEIGRKSLPTATALPTRSCCLLPRAAPILTMGGTLKLGWK